MEAEHSKLWTSILAQSLCLLVLCLVILDVGGIRYVSSTNCLGVTIDDKLSWSQHITSARSAFNAKVKMLRRINFLSTSILETFYYKIVIPSVLYGPKLKDLEMIHIRAARLIHKLPTSFKDSDILCKVCLLYTSPSPRDGLLSRMPSSA